MTEKTLFERFLPNIIAYSKQAQRFEILEASYALCLDLVTQFIFGHASGSNFIQGASRKTHEWLEHYENRYCPEAFWNQELPRLAKVLNFFGIDLLPKHHAASTRYLEDWMMDMCDSADSILKNALRMPEDTPVVYKQVKEGQEKSAPAKNPQENRLSIASELFDHMSGAREVLGLVVAYTIYYIARHHNAQDHIRAELSAAGISMKVSPKDTEHAKLPAPSSLDKLPYLAAVLQESFRMRPNSTPLPRVTPHDRSVSLGGYDDIPPATRVNTFQWLIHRDPSKWDAVDEWRPERWLKENITKETNSESRVWAFGGGSRMCLGINYTHYIMRYILVAIFTNFRVTAIENSPTIQVVPGSLNDKLFVQFTPLAD
ncbi:hypothetical protein PVAG01_08891 [Phlyctema vagabunda]|uniref:Cytochrome P450 n=1 Tax=Phlyctema vagabunda TaxID=108571 RepID=A0ABR4PAP7_9HELO